VRISATDWVMAGSRRRCGRGRRAAFADAGCDLIDVLDRADRGRTRSRCSAACTRRRSPIRIRNDAGLATCASARSPRRQVNTIIAAGRADLVALRARTWSTLISPEGGGLVRRTPAIHWPAAVSAQGPDLPHSAREREELVELKLKAKPKGHRDTWKEAAE